MSNRHKFYKKIQNCISILLLLIFFYSCTKNINKTIELKDIFACHESKKWDEKQLKQQLLGEWILYKDQCVFSKKNNYYKNIKVNISEDSISVFRKKVLLQKSKWKLVKNRGFIIITEPQISYLIGSISCCDNYFTADNQIDEGCNYLFIKKIK